MTEIITDKHFAFRKGSVLSNFAMIGFDLDGIHYKTGEHCFQHHKAIVFRNYDIASDILKAETPLEAKRLGRKISGFDEEIWKVQSPPRVLIFLLEKALQSPQIFDRIVREAKGKIMVEASPRDVIHGSGYGLERSANGESRGRNLLGKAWTETINNLNKIKL